VKGEKEILRQSIGSKRLLERNILLGSKKKCPRELF
jgi:hypothetical protein